MKFTTLFLSLLASALAQNDAAEVLPQPQGRYATDIQTLEVIDYSRPDPYDPNHGPRKLMVSVFTPTVLAKDCSHWETYPYTPPLTAELLEPLFETYGWPNSTSYINRLRLPTCAGENNDEFPVVLFSHGLTLTRLLSSSQAQAVAAQGFVVITIDQPYDASVIEYPDGTVVKARNWTLAELDGDVQTRAQDVSFLVTQLANTSSPLHRPYEPKVAMFGHSLGGASSVQAAYDDKRILAALDLDGSPYGFNTTVINASTVTFTLPTLTAPFLLFNEPSFVNNSGMPDLYAAFSGWKRHLALENSFHLTFTDLPLLVDTFGLRGSLPDTFEAYSGTIPGLRARDVVSEFVGAFMGKWLKGEESEVLDGPSEEWEEVEFVGVD
ncbi:hypothetical protein PRZ48_009414 [Zasmidium cellare]|uniref:1-alkyl-2-acetylglycerophosphocholine esterase n=1 Tax=Zasmidium cellare TaxID=395010 RepID=A0ABR0EBN9_ZASCE|nr:hypothetical protein PRZ48_009414 [Zasmidium cellare]